MREDRFKVFNDEDLGRIFVPDGILYEKAKAVYISPFHGRAVAIRTDDYKWINVKGGGWNYGGPQIYISVKDEELIFGLYPCSSAIRELEVSRKIEKISDRFPKVLYYKKILDFQLPSKYDFLKSIKFSNGAAVDPCIIYTQLKCPFRVADLMYLTEEERSSVIEYCCDYWGVSGAEYTKKFTLELAKNVAILHKNYFINDTLDYGNVTLLAEVVDYEWITAPEIMLLDGTDGTQIPDERKEKEILYGAEVSLQLRALLREEYSFFDIYNEFVEEYGKINFEFVKQNGRIHRILNKETFIL